VFWLDMGEAIRIGDLADRIISLGTPPGRRPAAVEMIGLRPGEKMHETLTAQGLDMRRTAFSRIWMARQQDVPRIEVYRALRGLRRACAAGSDAGVIEALAMAVADYQPSAFCWNTFGVPGGRRRALSRVPLRAPTAGVTADASGRARLRAR